MTNSDSMSSDQIIISDIMPQEAISIQGRINIIIEMDEKLFSIRDEIKDNKWDSLKDSRMLFIRFITELNSNTILQLAFQAESHEKLLDKEWVKKRLPHLEQKIDAISNMKEYSMNRNKNIASSIWNTFMLFFFFEFETRIRSIVRNLKKVINLQNTKKLKYLTGNEAFYWIYRGLYESYLRMNKADYEVLKIFSAIRNTIHNSGIFFSLDKKNRSFHYRNITYSFIYGKPVNFISSEFTKNMLTDLLSLFSMTVNHNRIDKVRLIKDPLVDIKFK